MTEQCSITPVAGEKISTALLKMLLASKTNLILIDARSSKWDDGRRIPGAISLTSEASAEEFASTLPQKDALIAVYCTHAQCGASSRLAQRLADLGYMNVLKYAEGIDVWAQQGNRIELNQGTYEK